MMTNTTELRRSARAALDRARQGHLLAIHAAIAASTPEAELAQDLAAFRNAGGQLLAIGRWQGADALPLVRRGTP